MDFFYFLCNKIIFFEQWCFLVLTVYRTKGKNQLSYKTQYNVSNFDLCLYMLKYIACLYVRSLAHVLICVYVCVYWDFYLHVIATYLKITGKNKNAQVHITKLRQGPGAAVMQGCLKPEILVPSGSSVVDSVEIIFHTTKSLFYLGWKHGCQNTRSSDISMFTMIGTWCVWSKVKIILEGKSSELGKESRDMLDNQYGKGLCQESKR